MSVLDVKRNLHDFLKRKGRSSPRTYENYTKIMNSFQKFCLSKYNSSLEELIEELAITKNCQEQVENLIQSYIDELEFEGKAFSTVNGHSTLAKNYLKYRRVNFDKSELESNLSFKKQTFAELYPITKQDIKTLLDHASFLGRSKILLQSGSGFRISEMMGLRKCDINTELERYTAHIRSEFAKNGKARTTIISIETMPYIDKLCENKNADDLLFPHETKNIQSSVITEINMFNRVRKKANLEMRYENNDRHKITTHSFRAFFISQFEKTYSGFGHALSGHQGRYMNQYERFTLGEKIEKYIETEKYLLIYEKPNQASEDQKELREMKAKIARLEELLSKRTIP